MKAHYVGIGALLFLIKGIRQQLGHFRYLVDNYSLFIGISGDERYQSLGIGDEFTKDIGGKQV